jgi:hypothetical protein
LNDDFDLKLRLAVYRHFADTGRSPALAEMARIMGSGQQEIRDAYQRLYARRMLVPDPDSDSIHMAPPFSGVATQHRVIVAGKSYFANCAWDAFGVVSALGGSGQVDSRCEQTHEPLRLHLTPAGPVPSDWRFHSVVPAAKWWDDIVFT